MANISAFLIRQYFDSHTKGDLVIGDQVFHTLERPWLGNQRNVSCIPPGTYLARYLPKSASGKYRRCWHITNVPNRAGILIHNGNLVKHTKGCPLLGIRHGRLAGKPAVLGSKIAMRRLLSAIGESDFELTVIGEPNA